MKLIPLSELSTIQTPLLLAQREADDSFTWQNIRTDDGAIQLHEFNTLLANSDRPSSIFYLRAVVIQDSDNPDVKLNSIAGICIYRKDGKGKVIFTPESPAAQDDNWVEFFRVTDGIGNIPDTLVSEGLDNSEHHRTLLMDLWNRSQQLQ